MGQKFTGSLDDVKARLVAVGISGDWTESNGNFTLRTRDGGIFNWSPTTGSLWLQGAAHAKHALEAKVRVAFAEPASTNVSIGASAQEVNSRERPAIFVVHGHDKDAREQLELALHRLGLEPFVLVNSSGGGDTIIEALEKRIGRNYTSEFGIVLFTPDDVGRAKNAAPEKEEARPRQNVILEAGMLVASLTRARVAFIVKGHMEMPSDLAGVIYAHFNDHVKEALPKVIARMQEAGIELDPRKIAAATSA